MPTDKAIRRKKGEPSADEIGAGMIESVASRAFDFFEFLEHEAKGWSRMVKAMRHEIHFTATDEEVSRLRDQVSEALPAALRSNFEEAIDKETELATIRLFAAFKLGRLVGARLDGAR